MSGAMTGCDRAGPTSRNPPTRQPKPQALGRQPDRKVLLGLHAENDRSALQNHGLTICKGRTRGFGLAGQPAGIVGGYGVAGVERVVVALVEDLVVVVMKLRPHPD